MKIKLYEKTYRKTQEHDGTTLIKTYSLDNMELEKLITKDVETDYWQLDLKGIKQRFPKCVKVIVPYLKQIHLI